MYDTFNLFEGKNVKRWGKVKLVSILSRTRYTEGGIFYESKQGNIVHLNLL